MAGFSDAERERIRDALLDAGREYFARYGLEKTTVSELADDAGISAGSFYSFFDSKERLYLAVLEREAESVYGDALAALNEADTPSAGVRDFLHTLFGFAEENPLFRQLLAGGHRERLVAATSEADRDAYREQKVALLAPYVTEWQEAGEVRAGDPETLALAVESIGVLPLHEDEYGSREEYEAVRDALIELVAAGLTATDE